MPYTKTRDGQSVKGRMKREDPGLNPSLPSDEAAQINQKEKKAKKNQCKYLAAAVAIARLVEALMVLPQEK